MCPENIAIVSQALTQQLEDACHEQIRILLPQSLECGLGKPNNEKSNPPRLCISPAQLALEASSRVAEHGAVFLLPVDLLFLGMAGYDPPRAGHASLAPWAEFVGMVA
jgi:hypothetical protein